jgi:SAM-dependent methyltransferase
MDHREVGQYWQRLADTWADLARAGFDVYRDAFNTPAFLDRLPDVHGRRGLDIGCGEGHNTRLLARRGARMTGIDVAQAFIARASEAESAEPLGIAYRVASALELPFAEASFDFATAFMSLMDMPAPDHALAEAARVLAPGGFLQFSICHPCTNTPHRRNRRDDDGRTYALELGGYWDTRPRVERWLFGATPPELRAELEPFEIPVFHRPVSDWINGVIAAGLRIERVEEPRPTDDAVADCPDVQDARVMPYFLHVRARKP